MQLFATFFKNKCNFLSFLVQQQLALIIILENMGAIVKIRVFAKKINKKEYFYVYFFN